MILQTAVGLRVAVWRKYVSWIDPYKFARYTQPFTPPFFSSFIL